MEKKTQETLSDKVHLKERIDNSGFYVQDYILKEDVKAFIKDLNEELSRYDNFKLLVEPKDFIEYINKLAGEDLI